MFRLKFCNTEKIGYVIKHKYLHLWLVNKKVNDFLFFPEKLFLN